MANKKIAVLCIIAAAILVSFIFLYAGHFSSKNRKTEDEPVVTPAPVTTADTESAVKYEHLTPVINGNRQEINLLRIDVSKPGVKIMPVLSGDLIYGFENMSAMISRKSAYAAVNGGFFSKYGLPSGMVAIDGRLISNSSGKYPVFTVSGGKASLGEIKNALWLDYGRGRLKVDRLNSPASKNETAVYTPAYGESSRADAENLTVTVKNGRITDIGLYEGEAEIPEEGMLVVFMRPDIAEPDMLPVKKGDTVKLVSDPGLPPDLQAYECGSWLVKDGAVAVKDRDALVGVMTNRDPRTAVGIGQDGKVVLFTVDGRQPGYSAGLTGKELAGYLLELGVTNAAMLDGGASTEMIVNGKIVNKPSFKGQERPLAGCLAVIAP